MDIARFDVRSSDGQEQFRRHLRAQQPAVLRGCYEGQPLAEFQDLEREQAMRRMVGILGETRLPIAEEYTSILFQDAQQLTPRVGLRWWTLDEYFEHIAQNPHSRKMCTEMLAIDALRPLFRPPSICRHGWGPPDEWIAKTFIGNRGNTAHLHFDFDFRQVLLHQVFGRKRVVLIPIEASWKLMPVINFSSFYLEHFREEEKTELLRYAGAFDCVLEPGETIFMPALWWHYIEYVDTGMSIAIRFGRSRHNTFLKEHFGNHVTTELQLVCSHLIDEEIAGTRNAQVFARLEEATRRPFASGLERYRELQKLFKLLGAELSPQTFIEHAWRGHSEAAQERYIAEMHDAHLRGEALPFKSITRMPAAKAPQEDSRA